MSEIEFRHVLVDGQQTIVFGHPDDLYFHSVCTQEAYDSHLTTIAARSVGSDSVVLDVGGNIGFFALSTAIRAAALGRTDLQIYAFEPARINHEPFEMMLATNPDSTRGIHLCKFGLSAHDGSAMLNFTPGNTAGAHIAAGMEDHYSQAETIDLRRLSTFLSEANVDRIDFVKIDIEGHEQVLLESMTDEIRRFRPALLVEVNGWVIDMVARTATSTFVDFLTSLAPHAIGVHSDGTFIDIKRNRTAFLRANLLAKTHQDVLLDFDEERLRRSLQGFSEL